MTFKQWWKHFKHWFYLVSNFPFPWSNIDDVHLLVGVVGEKEKTCLICGFEYTEDKQ